MYVELDRDTYFHDRVAARKTPGYKKLLASRFHRKHFPDTTLDHFYVLFFAPTEKRSRQLRDAFAKKNADDPALKIYRFGSFETLTPENIRSVRPSHGLHPKYYFQILGKPVIRDLQPGHRLTLADIDGGPRG